MIFDSLSDFIRHLDAQGELIRIRESVSPLLEIAEITDRVSKSPEGGKALLFENVEGHTMPVLINAFGSWKRIQAALGVKDLEDIPKEIERFIKLTPPTTLLDKAKLIPMLLEASRFPPRRVTGNAPCQEVVHTGDAVDLNTIPIIQCWPEDAGRFITFPIVINKCADGKIRNVGLYRMQVYDKNTTGMHWHIHKDGAHFFHEYKKRNQRMEVAVAIGADPVSCYSASAPLPYGVDEFLLAGFLRKKPVPLVACKTVNLEVPANAEIVLEGYIDPQELRLEGPFGDHTGYYSQDDDYPVFHVTAITHRKNPVYLTTIVGIPPQEDYYLGKATERIFLPLLRTQLPEIIDMNMPLEGVFHNCVIVSIEKRYPMQARHTMNTLWAAGQMGFVKTIVVVDADVDVQDEKTVLELILNDIDLDRDLHFTEGILDVLNHASDKALYGSKLGIDATRPITGEPEASSPAQPPAIMSAELIAKAQEAYPDIKTCRGADLNVRRSVLLAGVEKTGPHEAREFIEEFLNDDAFREVGVVLALEPHVDLNNKVQVLWKLFNNLDPKRDIYIVKGRVGIDLSRKLPEEGYQQRWPEEIEMSQDIKKKIDDLWPKTFK